MHFDIFYFYGYIVHILFTFSWNLKSEFFEKNRGPCWRVYRGIVSLSFLPAVPVCHILSWKSVATSDTLSARADLPTEKLCLFKEGVKNLGATVKRGSWLFHWRKKKKTQDKVVNKHRIGLVAKLFVAAMYKNILNTWGIHSEGRHKQISSLGCCGCCLCLIWDRSGLFYSAID